MKKKQKLFAIGIVTHSRPAQLFRLLQNLNEQATLAVDVFINENGSDNITGAPLGSFTRLHSTLIKQKEASVLTARNSIVRVTEEKYRWLIFVDDDCMLDKNWLHTIIAFFHKSAAKTYWAIQGVAESFPKDNPYAQSSGLLYRLWFEKNTTGNRSFILDTKCCALNLRTLARAGLFFDETLPFDAGDIDLSCRMQELDRKNKVFVLRKWRIHHEERTRFIPYLLHRARLSAAFRFVRERHPGMLASEELGTKLQFLWGLMVTFPVRAILIVGLLLAQIVARTML